MQNRYLIYYIRYKINIGYTNSDILYPILEQIHYCYYYYFLFYFILFFLIFFLDNWAYHLKNNYNIYLEYYNNLTYYLNNFIINLKITLFVKQN